MIKFIQSVTKRKYYYLFALPLVFVLYMPVNVANAKESKPKGYTAVSQKPMRLTNAQLAGFAGKYQFMNDYVTITPANGGIIVQQLQGQHQKIAFYATGLYEFHTRHFGRPYWLYFSSGPKSKAPSFVTSDHDIWVRVK